mgnify:CR=1 FL=1
MGVTLDIQTPRVFAPLLEPSRYKGAWGGRGSGKSHFFAEMLVEECILKPGTNAVCIREIQKSLKQSVKRLIEEKIVKLGVSHLFRVLEAQIGTPGGGVIIFQGMQNHTADTIKSLQGFRIAWIEEAQSLSERSLRLLRPTIRDNGSEIWASWNPESPEDPIDKFFRAADADKSGMVCIRANWSDNPWFGETLEDERRRDQRDRPDEYDHVWEGDYLTRSDAIIFARRVRVEEFNTPLDTRFYYGADWGFANDPTALVRCWIDDEVLHVDYEAFGNKIEMDELPTLFDEIPGCRDWPIKADGARPETISYMSKRHQFKITAANKWPGSVEDGVSRLKAFREIRVHPRCSMVAEEFRKYAYKVDRQTDDILPIIVDDWNHGIDAIRYALDGIIQNRRNLAVSDDVLARSRGMMSSRPRMR